MIGIIIISLMIILGLAGFKVWRLRRRQAKAGGYTNLDKKAPLSASQVPPGSYQNAPSPPNPAVPPDVPQEVMIDLEKALRSTSGEKSKLVAGGSGPVAASSSMRGTVDLVMAYVRSFTD